ncbi:MAG: nuclear transport factor 2 family protein [Saprospiraceae bacterium]|nr:nuclear transport factor 2 family protein [Saprospiraceae bacterium]
MKKSVHNNLLFAMLLAVVGTAPLFAQSAQTKDATKEIAPIAKAWQDAYNRRDHAALASMYTTEIASVGQDGTTSTITKAQLEEQFKSDFMTYNTQTEVKIGSASLLSDGKARVIDTYTNSNIDLKTGVRTVETGTYDHVLVKQAGAWKLTQIHVIPTN